MRTFAASAGLFCLSFLPASAQPPVKTPDMTAIRKQFAQKDATIAELRREVADLTAQVAALRTQAPPAPAAGHPAAPRPTPPDAPRPNVLPRPPAVGTSDAGAPPVPDAAQRAADAAALARDNEAMRWIAAWTFTGAYLSNTGASVSITLKSMSGRTATRTVSTSLSAEQYAVEFAACCAEIGVGTKVEGATVYVDQGFVGSGVWIAISITFAAEGETGSVDSPAKTYSRAVTVRGTGIATGLSRSLTIGDHPVPAMTRNEGLKMTGSAWVEGDEERIVMRPPPGTIFIGCAGWNIPKEYAPRFPPDGSHLERYARRLPAVEINSSFYRPHQRTTYARWAQAVPAHFRFAVKVPRRITHQCRLKDAGEPLERFLEECTGLGDRLGPLLVQLPPSLTFDGAAAAAFFEALRRRFAGGVVCEPRHPSWFGPEAERLLSECRVARAAADPPPVPEASWPGGWGGLVYYRWHGSPQVYYSTYSEAALATVSEALGVAARSAEAWCIFDNTALGAATANALAVLEHLTGTAR